MNRYDLVYDPFSGTGTVTKAAIASERNSISIDIDTNLCERATFDLIQSVAELNLYTMDRVSRHIEFINSLPVEKKEKLYDNVNHSFKVKTKQETEILFTLLNSIRFIDDKIVCTYEKADA